MITRACWSLANLTDPSCGVDKYLSAGSASILLTAVHHALPECVRVNSFPHSCERNVVEFVARCDRLASGLTPSYTSI